MLAKDGVATMEQVHSRFPNHEILVRPKAIIECYENIPCNPCRTSCPFEAITIGEDINNKPEVNFDKCTGCGVCIYSCPGLAIIVCEIKDDKVRFKISYETLPYPVEGEIWNAVNRKGEVIGDALIEKVTLTKRQDRTALVQVLVDKAYLYDFVTIRRIMSNKDVIICRCEDVTLQDLHNLMDQGYTRFEELKRLLRIGMGPCQSNTCGQLVQREISKYLNVKLEDVKTQKVRPLTTGVKLNSINEGANHES